MQTNNPVALVTGASIGIGAACARLLAEQGYRLVLMARRLEKLEQLNQDLGGCHHVIACDVTDLAAVSTCLSSIPKEFKSISVLVNNAGLALGLEPAQKAKWAHWETMIQTNCTALSYITRQILPGMVERNQGHVINIGSIAGTYAYQGGNAYGATKAFVEQFSMGLRADLLGTSIRVSNVEPGLTGGTEFSNVRFEGDDDKADSVYQGCNALTPENIAETVMWLIQQPPHVNINRVEMMPVCQAPAGLAVHKV